MHNEIMAVKAKKDALLKKDPSDERLKFVATELERLAALVNLRWPITEEDKQNVIIGLYAVREIEDSNPDLAVSLTHIAYDFKHS